MNTFKKKINVKALIQNKFVQKLFKEDFFQQTFSILYL